MPTRLNLFPNPALKNNATGWTSTAGDYTRYASAGTAGKTTDGSSSSSSSANRVWVSQGTPTTTGVLQTGVARFSLDAAGSTTVRFVVYADAAGEPGAKLAESADVVCTHTTEQAITFTFSGGNQITLNSGTNYWLGIAWTDPGTPNVVISRDGTATSRREQSWTPPTLPDPFGTPLASNTGPIDAVVNVSSAGNLPRPTGWTGTSATDSNTPRAQTPPGSSYVYSVSIEAIGAQTFNMLVNFYDASSGGAFLGNSGASVPVSLTAGQVARFVLGPYTPPAGTVSSHLKFNDIDAGGVRISAIRCSPSTGNLERDSFYFDGDTPGAVWDGAAGDSTSTFRIFEDTPALDETWSRTETAVGPVTADQLVLAEALSVTATSTVADPIGFRDGFLIAALSFDEARGRVRLEAFTFAEQVTTARVRRRRLGGRWDDVRGGRVDVVGGLMARLVDDYEYPAGITVEYLIEGVDDTGRVWQSALVRRTAAADGPWLKFIANPALNRPVQITGWSEISREPGSETFKVSGDRNPRVVSDVHGSRQVTVQLAVHDVEAADALDDALADGHAVFFQVPPELQLPTMYATVGKYSWRPPTLRSVRSIFSIPLTEVAAPPPSVVPRGVTYADSLAAYPLYSDRVALGRTYREAGG